MAFDPEYQVRGTGPRTGVGTLPAPEDPAAAELTAALQGLYRALQKLAMYPSGHPSVPEAIVAASRRFERALAGRKWVLVRVTREDLIWDDRRLSDGSEILRSLAGLLHELDLAALEFRTGLRERELETFVHSLTRARRDSVRGRAFVETLERAQIETIRACAIDYRALSIADGVQQGSESSANLWEHLSEILTDPETYATDAPVQELADEVSAQVQALEGTGVNELRGELHRRMRETDSLAEEQGKVFRRRMGDFVAALNPDLRRNLLQVGSQRTRESLSLMNELSESIPPDEILDALQNVDRVGGEAHDELVQLLQKLVRISRDRPAMQNDLADTLDRWGVPLSVLHDSGRLGEAVEEVFRRRSQEDYNPIQYKNLLGKLASAELSGIIPESAKRYGDPSDVEAMRAHCTEISVLLLGRHDGDEYRPALFGYAGTHVDGLLNRGTFAPVVHAVVAARADRALKRDDDTIQRAAQGFLDDFLAQERIELIVSRLDETRPLSIEERGLLELGGSTALEALLERLSREIDSVFAASLREFCAERGPDVWAEVLDRREAVGWTLLEPVFPVLRQMKKEAALPILRRLFEHEASRVRREAMIVMCEVDEPACQEYVALALRDESLRVVNTGLRRLAATGKPETVAMLGAYAAGHVPGSWFNKEAFNLALSLLLSLREPGEQALCFALDSLVRSLRPLNARRARRLATVLATRREDSPRVREALGRWRRSPARLLSFLLPRIDPRQGAR